MPTPIRFKGIVGTTAQIATDRFAGRIAFDSTLNRFVMFYDATNYATMARRDVLETFAAGIQDSTLTAGRVMLAGTSGRHQTSALFSYITSPSVLFMVGDGVTASQSAISVDAPSTSDALLSLRSANFSRWTLSRVATTLDFALAARNSSGVLIDNPINIVNASAGLITIGGSTSRTTNFTGAIQTSGVTRISSGGAGTLTTLSTTGLATLQSVNITGLTASRMLSLDGSKNVQSLDAAGSRTLIGAYGSGSNAAFGTLSTTGLATLAQATVSDITATHVMFGGTAGRVSGSANMTFDSATTIFMVGSSALAAGPRISIDAAAGQSRYIRIRSGTGARWAFGGGSQTESGANAGTDFEVLAFTDAGGAIDTPLRIVRAAGGTVTVSRPLTTTGLATMAQATVSDLTTGRMVSTTTGGRLQALNYVPLGNTTLGVGEPRICSGVAGGNLLVMSGLDVTDGTNFAFLQLTGSGGTSILSSSSGGALTIAASNAALGFSSSGPIAHSRNSVSEVLSGNIFNQYATVTQTGIVTQQSLASTGAGSRSLAAGRLNTLGAGLELYLCGTYTTDASPGNATIRIRIGSTTFRTIGAFALDGSITGAFWRIVGRISCRTTGATGAIGGQLVWEHQSSSVAGSQVMHIETATSSADVTVDLTASQTIDVDWTATDAGTSIVCTCFSIDSIR